MMMMMTLRVNLVPSPAGIADVLDSTWIWV